MIRIDTTHYENFDPEIASWYLHKEGDVKIITNESDLTSLDMAGSSKGEVVVYAHSTSSEHVFTYYKYLGTGTGADRFKNVGDLTVAKEGEGSTYTGPFMPNILIDFRRGELFVGDNAAFRVDGSGYLSNKALSWNPKGDLTMNNTTIKCIRGSKVAYQLNPDGSGQLANSQLSWTSDGVLVGQVWDVRITHSPASANTNEFQLPSVPVGYVKTICIAKPETTRTLVNYRIVGEDSSDQFHYVDHNGVG